MKPGWTTTALGELVTWVSGGTPKRSVKDYFGSGIPWLSIADLTDGPISRARESITKAGLENSSAKEIDPGTIVIAMYGSIGKLGVTEISCCASQAIAAATQVNRSLDSRYLYRLLFAARREIQRLGRGNTQSNIGLGDLKEFEIPLPPLDEQRRIAAVLDHVDTLRAKRREAIAMTVRFNDSAFSISYEGLGEQSVELAEIADIGSGITKGRKLPPGTLADTPYLAVSNVQDGWLDLTVVKTIAISEVERRRFELRAGDIVLTEGGDPDKLGRGTVWQGQISPMIHQNHIFRVRSRDTEGVLPNFLARALRSREARSHFLRSAKQTTGIATINKTQLSRTPIRIPSPDVQGEVVAVAMAAEEARAAAERHLAELDNLFAALQSRAFVGELDVSKVVLPSS